MMMRATTWATTSRATKAHAALIAMLLVAGTISLVVVGADAEPLGAAGRSRLDAGAGSPLEPVPAPAVPSSLSVAPGVTGPGALLATDESGVSAASATTASASASSGNGFSKKYPAQAAAYSDPSVPASNYWALLIGINDYAGSTRDNVGSYQDARDLRKHLLALGWQDDHIAFIKNRDATVPRILQGIRWLASKTDSSSTVVFHYSGHERPVKTSSDGDNEARDVAIWASDNKLLLDGTLGRELGKVAAQKMWIDLAVCRAGGFSDKGMIKPGRVLTFSSPESELSYEDPQLRHSVFGWYVIMEGMRQRLGDLDGNGVVTVEEAFSYAKPWVTQRTGGRQHPKIIDKLAGQFDLRVPKPAPPPEQPPSGGSDPGDGGCTLFWLCGPGKEPV